MGKKSRKEKEKERARFLIILLILLILVAAIFFFYLSFGKINLLKQREEKKKRLEWLEKHLFDLYSQKLTLQKKKAKLDHIVKVAFLITRILIAVIYIALNVLAVIFWTGEETFNHKLHAVLNYNEALILIIAFTLFVIYEKATDIKDIPEKIHRRIKNRIYRADPEIEREIIEVEKQMRLAAEEKRRIEAELREIP